MHTELLSYSATQPNTGAAAAAFTGDSLTIKNSRNPAHVVAMWGFNQVDGYHQIVWPSGHDTTRGWRTVMETANIIPRNVMGTAWKLEPQELLSITIAGSNTAGDVETGHLLLHYDDLPGVTSRAIEWDDLLRRGEEQVTVQATITGTAAGYSGSEAINADSDLLRANRDYALLGMETTTDVGAICISGPDTGNVRTAVPGAASRPDYCGNFYAILSRAYNKPLIPIINSGNRASTNLSLAMNENAGATVVSLNLVMLRKRE